MLNRFNSNTQNLIRNSDRSIFYINNVRRSRYVMLSHVIQCESMYDKEVILLVDSDIRIGRMSKKNPRYI
jgi:hypothetical protein